MGQDRFINMEDKKITKKYLFWIIFILLIIAAYLVLRPFMLALISAFILSYFIRPLYIVFNKRLKLSEGLSSILCVVLVILLIVVPSFFIIKSTISQLNFSFNIANFSDKFLNNLLDPATIIQIKEYLAGFFISLVTSIISSIPSAALSLLVLILGVYYILINWNFLADQLESMLPFKDKKRVSKEIANISNNIIFGYLLIALLELTVGIIGFYLSGVKLFLILPIFIAILAFVPGLGPGVVWVPTALFYLLNNDYPTAIGVIITGLTISLVIETIILPRLVGGKSNIHPFIFLIGVLGGVPIFGVFGFIIGPLILFYAIKLIREAIN